MKPNLNNLIVRGVINDLRIYKKALSQEEVKALKNE